MLGNTFLLTYKAASFELKLQNMGRNRWWAYSAPFAKTYSGDFMLRGSDGYPIKKAVYMSFFQETNPDNSSETATTSHFTQSFSKEDMELTLGKGFILYVDGTRDPGNTSFQFPSPVDQYEYYYVAEYVDNLTPNLPMPPAPFSKQLDRGNPEINNRFIAEMGGPTYSTTGTFNLPIPNDRNGSSLLMLVNPFCASLAVDSILKYNASILVSDRYYIWGGSEEPGFISFLKSENRWIISDANNMPQDSLPLIPPYHAFFVLKKNTGLVTSIVLSETWTTTVRGTKSKQAKAGEKAWYVNVSSGGLTGSTALFASEETSHTPALFLNGNQVQSLDVYTLDNEGKAASITGFSTGRQEVKLGLRLKQSGEIELGLQGLDTDAYQVYLKDDGQRIDLSGGKKYKTTIVRPADANKTYFEINDRFSLLIEKN
jgi:hypothetical protein